MSYSLILAFLLAFSLLPPAYIRYVPFQTIVTPHTKRILIGMYMCIFLCEFLGMNAAFYTAALAPTWMFCKFFLMVAWIPYFLVNLCIIRSYIPQHIFILGMQSIYMISMHTLSMNIVLSWVPAAQFDAYIVVHEVLYIALFILFLPIIRWFFLKIFLQHQAIHRPYIWKYCCLIPLLISVNQGFFMASPSPLSQLYIWPRFFNALAGIALAMAVYQGISHLSQRLIIHKKNILLQNKLQQLHQYTRSLDASYRRMSVLRHDTRHQIRILSALLQEENTDEALAFIHTLQQELPPHIEKRRPS